MPKTMLDWATIASLATAGTTLVLAFASFASVRSGNRTARAAERSLQANLRPLLGPSRLQDPSQKVGFDDIQYSALGVGAVPSMPWINRPTFQQVVSFPSHR
jgi:hypothetical protein